MKRMLCVVLVLVWVLTACAAVPGAKAAVPVREEAPRRLDCGTPYTPPEPEVPEPEELVRVVEYIPNIAVELKYATADNFTGQVIYDFHEVWLRYGTVEKLALAQAKLNELGWGLLIWDGFRPVSAQWALWRVCPDPAYVSHPETGRRAHCRGNAVDVTLIDLESGQMLEMPTGFDCFTAQADRDYSDCTATAAENARLLEQVMESCGFTGYWSEWWHYTDSDDYPVETEFSP